MGLNSEPKSEFGQYFLKIHTYVTDKTKFVTIRKHFVSYITTVASFVDHQMYEASPRRLIHYDIVIEMRIPYRT